MSVNHNAMQGIGDWVFCLRLEQSSIAFGQGNSSQSATLQRFQLAFKHLLLLENKFQTSSHFFKTLSLISILFQVWKSSLQISRLFQGFKTLNEPWLSYQANLSRSEFVIYP